MAQFNIYEEITNRLLAEMEKGVIPWHKPWTCTDGAVSHANGRPYSLINQAMLGYGGEWLTFTQIKKEGGSIRKGEKSRWVVFWKMYEKEKTKADGTKVIDVIPILRYYHVWEIAQCDGTERKYDPTQGRPKIEPIVAAENIVNGYRDREQIRLNIHETIKAYYSPLLDEINAPQMSQYDCPAEYYSTLFHEMTHSTGHRTRLARFVGSEAVAAFGSESYSKEELIAELGAAFLVNHAGIDSHKAFHNSAAYLQSWSRKLKQEPKLFVMAAGKAEAAVKYILNGKENGNGSNEN